MATLTDRTIAALRANHDELAGLVPGLSEKQLTGGSGASEWSVAQVLSHLGSGAEITLAGLNTAVNEAPAPGDNFNQQVWDRWNAKPAAEQARDFVTSDAALVAALESLSQQQRAGATVRMGFLPSPVSMAVFTGMRLNEAIHHGWDVRVAVDPSAAIHADAAQLLAEHLSGELSFLLGFIGKADALAAPATLDVEGSGFGIVVDGAVRLITPVSALTVTATFTGPLESAIRLTAGRLAGPYTPAEVTVKGSVDLDDLRRVFPGF